MCLDTGRDGLFGCAGRCAGTAELRFPVVEVERGGFWKWVPTFNARRDEEIVADEDGFGDTDLGAAGFSCLLGPAMGAFTTIALMLIDAGLLSAAIAGSAGVWVGMSTAAFGGLARSTGGAGVESIVGFEALFADVIIVESSWSGYEFSGGVNHVRPFSPAILAVSTLRFSSSSTINSVR